MSLHVTIACQNNDLEPGGPGGVCLLFSVPFPVFQIEVYSIDDGINTTVQNCCQVENIQDKSRNLKQYLLLLVYIH